MINKIQLFVLICFLSCASCKGLKPRNNISNVTYPIMKTFDIDKFNRFKDSMSIGVAEYKLDDGSLIKANKFGNEYQIIRKASGSPYSVQYRFRSDLSLMSMGQLFYDIWYGRYYEYDRDGNITKQVDQDNAYKFSLNDLVNKLLRDYKIDLMTMKKGTVIRRFVNGRTSVPQYEIRYPSDENPNKIRRLIINGDNGRVMSDTFVGPPQDG